MNATNSMVTASALIIIFVSGLFIPSLDDENAVVG